MEKDNIHQRVLKLRDVALGSKKAVSVGSCLAPASYDCAVDSLIALYCECKGASSLARDKNVLKFINRYECTVSALNQLRVCADDFEIKATIGRGHFGEVVLTREKSTGDVFAMKIMKKAHILQQPDAAFYSAERDIMAWSTSPWLTSLHYAFQDPTSLYLVMDYHPGGDLLNIMERKEGCMQNDEARFYLAEIAAGLHDLHRLGFVHRDVKPENVLIARSGHIKLVDFGSAARLDNSGKVIESRLPVGTPEYISPEVLTSLDRTADYGVCCDWWSLGIIAYELLYETTPFEGDSTRKTYSNIMSYKKCLAFPEGSEDDTARDLIRKLLTDMRTRLTFPGIQTHPFFADISWNHLLNTTPPHIPTLSGPDDVSNFDVFEPCKDDSFKYPDLPSKSTGFVGRSLPFIGFTFTAPISSEDFTDSFVSADAEGVQSGELGKALELAKKEMGGERKKRISLERECAVYQSQLEDFHRKLEMEKSNRRVSESRALQLLQEVKEKGKLAQQLREEQARTTEVEYSVVVEQLEQERQEASRRSQRLQDKLKELQKERDAALKKGSEYKAKLSEAKEGSRKDTASLQAKLAKVSKESSSKVDEIRERYAEALKKKDLAEAAKKKVEMELRKLKGSMETRSAEDLSRQLKETKTDYEHLQGQMKNQAKAKEFLEKSSASFSGQLKKLEEQLEESQAQVKILSSEKLELGHMERDSRLQLEEVKRERDSLVASGSKASEDLKARNLELKKVKEEHSKLEIRLSETKTLREISHKTNTDEKLKKRVEGLERERLELKRDLSAANSELRIQVRENKALAEQVKTAEASHKQAVASLQAEVRSLQAEVKEKTSQEDKKIKELKKAERQLKQQNTTLSTKLSIAQSNVEKYEHQLRESQDEMEKLQEVQDNLKREESKAIALQFDNESTRKELLKVQVELRELRASRNKAEESLSNIQKQLSVKQLDAAMSQQRVKSLTEELKEAKASAADAQKQHGHLKTQKDVLERDLETAEAKLEDAYATIEMEKRARLTTDQRMSEVAADMQKQVSTHAEELQNFSNQLLMQKELATKYSVKVLEVEQESRLKALTLKEAHKELSTEKAVSSKFYDEVQLKSRELNKLKAAHMKLLKETQEANDELSQLKQTLSQQRMLSAEHQLQETRLQATIAQQGKLIDYLQGMGRSPEAKGLGRLKGLKLGRKGRDPAREIAEWNKLKGIAGKGNTSGVTQSASSQSMSGLPLHQSAAETSSSTLTSPPRTLSPHTTSTDPGLPSEEGDLAAMDSSPTPAQHRMDALVTSTPNPRSATTAGMKRKSSEVTSSHPTAESTAAASKQMSGRHNIPHVFRGISKSGIRSNYTCAACKGPIKALQKLIKCSHCHIPCHAQCIDTITNNCGLTEELSAYTEREEPAAKRKKQDPPKATTVATPSQSTTAHLEAEKGSNRERSARKQRALKATGDSGVVAFLEPVQFVGKVTGKKKSTKSKAQLIKVSQLSEDGIETTDGGEKGKSPPAKAGKETTLLQVSKVTSSADEGNHRHISNGASNGNAKCVKNIYTGFESSKVIKMEKTSQPRGGMMTEGWLVLTLDSLCLYDRDPRGVTRKPIHRIKLNEPGVAYIVVPSVSRQNFPHTSPANLVKAFGVQVYSSVQSKELCFQAASLQSKIDWVEAIQKVLSEHLCPPPMKEEGNQVPSSGSAKASAARELKAVSIVPLASPGSAAGAVGKGGSNQSTSVLSSSMQCGVSGGSALDLSIRSSMLNSSSDDSFI